MWKGLLEFLKNYTIFEKCIIDIFAIVYNIKN